jgi:oxygen-independent coproporphyrinogen III oxidase
MSMLPLTMSDSDYGVYVHFPFCATKCGYCDFSSVAAVDIPHARYADAVLRELDARRAVYDDGALRSIYIGGGTPSLWDPAELGRVLREIAVRCDDPSELEISVEVNPGSATPARLAQLRRAGVNRISVGVQSLDDVLLRALTRRHTAAQARGCIATARREGFDNISCDVIFGVAAQTVAQHLDGLRAVLELRPSHVSTYALTLSESAPLRRAGMALPDEERLAEMMEAGRELLAAAGLPQYEVSNYAAPARRCRHNAMVWAGAPYLGLGAAAHSMSWRGAAAIRVANPPLAVYLADPCAASTVEVVDELRSRHEVLFLGLRTVDGVDRAAYRRRFGADLLTHFQRLRELERLRLVQIDDASVAPTARGLWLADELAVRLMP